MFLFLLMLLLPSGHSEVRDRLLHLVSGRVITTSDVAFEAEFVKIDRSPVSPLNDPMYSLDQRLIDYAILREKAGDTSVYQPSASEVRSRWEHFHSSWPSIEDHTVFLQRWGMNDEQLQGFIFSRLVVEHYIHRNIGLAVQQAGGDDVFYITLYQRWMAELRSLVIVRSPVSQ
jgi:hypothetical protein